MNIFERAVRAKLRFTSSVGILSAEDIFELPLTNTGNRASLDKIAREVYSELKTFDEISFVDTKPNPVKIELQLKFDIIKHVIESKKADLSAAETRLKNDERRRKLSEILAKKQDASLEGMSEEDILKELEALEV